MNNRHAPPRQLLTFEQNLRLERRILTAEIAQANGRPCLPNPNAWDDNVAKPIANKLCQSCPVAAAKACLRIAVIDEAILHANSGRNLYMIVWGTRGGMNPRARRPLVTELADQIITDRIDHAERARAEAERKRAEAVAAKAGAAA
ncbi:hypothetical protein [Nonomuraea sp. NPDC049141]|uniref:hypothetical protein n=1 Tax=Nonomuraea sp. NPDC049141 TaxID=3155500 RepID=UPI0033C71DFE